MTGNYLKRMNSSPLDLVDFDEEDPDNATVEKVWEVFSTLEDMDTQVYLPFILKGES